jgi:glycosyltransferase involved in cell wall biosynthesis
LVGLGARLVLGRSTPVTAFFYGADIWGAGPLDRRLRRYRTIRRVTISSFSAGALGDGQPPLVLPPPVEEKLHQQLLGLPRSDTVRSGLHVLSVFRLSDYIAKGGPEVLMASEALRADGYNVTLTVAGLDAPCDDLEADLESHEGWMRAVRSPSTEELVDLYAQADLFVLATRRQGGPEPSGEGFGIVLAEAALAGLPVIAPANDGSRDAVIPGVTGLFPHDESVDALITVLRWMADHPDERRAIGHNGRVWAGRAFDPARFQERTLSVLWGRPTGDDWLEVRVTSP